MLRTAMADPARRRPALAVRLGALLLCGLTLPGTVVFVVSLILAVNGTLRFGGRFLEHHGLGWLWRPEGWLPIVGLAAGVIMLRMREASAERLMRRLVR